MDKDGYVILKGWLTDLPSVDGIRTEPIFNDNPDARADKKRKQATLKTGWARQIRDRLAADWPELTPSAGVLLDSEPGCQRQAAHCDYIPSAELAAANPSPLLVLIAIDSRVSEPRWLWRRVMH